MKTKEFKAGEVYFFNQNGKLKMAVLQYCEKCGKACHVNAVSVTKASPEIVAEKYNCNMDESEMMNYDEETDLNVCENC
jgi:hypothetical protein